MSMEFLDFFHINTHELIEQTIHKQFKSLYIVISECRLQAVEPHLLNTYTYAVLTRTY